MALGLVSKVEDQLSAIVSKQITERITLVAGVDKELQNITTNLRKIQQVLDNAEIRQTTEINIREWLEKLEDHAYEMEDMLDEWNNEIHRQQLEADDLVEKVWCCFLSHVLCFKQLKGRHDIAVKIKKLNEKLELIVKEKDKYNFLPSVKVKSNEWKRAESTWNIDESIIFGREIAKNQLIGELCRDAEENGLPIIKIVGAGGIGKTTLSQLAFNDDLVKIHFTKRIWVCVGEAFDGLKIANQIRKFLNKDSKDESDMQAVLLSIQGYISGMKILLVLDDVWRVNEAWWENLRNCFTAVIASGSKIVVTTRYYNVAKEMGATVKVDIGMLSVEECWSVIQRVSFLGRSQEESEAFKDVGMRIADKCKGLPLAAKTLGSLLRFRETIKEWERVEESDLWVLEEVLDGLFPHLQLSYNDLPRVIKRCFVYCAVFPKDHIIFVDDLIRMWMAHGYVSSTSTKRGEEIEQVGFNYFKILTSRAFFQEVREEDGLLNCKMHDIVHDFAQYLAKEERFTIGDGANVASCKNARHLILNCAEENINHVSASLLSEYRTGKARSIFINGGGIDILMLRLICHFRYLRTLRLKSINIRELPKEVGNLSHLRLLDVAETQLEEFPDTISNLYNLQTLYCGRYMSSIPLEIGQLANLRTLLILDATENEFWIEIPQTLENLTGLQNLPFYYVGTDSNKLEYLRKLNNLRGVMSISFMVPLEEAGHACDAKKAELEKKKIDHLMLLWNGMSVHIDVVEALKPHPDLSGLDFCLYGGNQLPGWIMELGRLRNLKLSGCSWLDSMPPLWKLPSLETLEVAYVRFENMNNFVFFEVEEIADNGGSSFPKLKSLTLLGWTNLVEWEDLQQEVHVRTVLPHLQRLAVNDTTNLKALPFNLLSKAIKLESIEFNGVRYGPMSSCTSTQPPFAPVGAAPHPTESTSGSPAESDEEIEHQLVRRNVETEQVGTVDSVMGLSKSLPEKLVLQAL